MQTTSALTVNMVAAVFGSDQAPDHNPAAAYLAGLPSGRSQIGVASDLRRIAQVLGFVVIDQKRNREIGNPAAVNWRAISAAAVNAILARIDGAPATRNRIRAVLRGVARWAWRMGCITQEERARIDDIKGARGSREPAGRDVAPWEQAALMLTCADDQTPAGARDAALIGLAIGTGARREEFTVITLADVAPTADGFEISVIGKGNKARTLYVTRGAARAMADWLLIRGATAGPLFCAITQTGTIMPEHGLTTTSAHKVLQKRVRQARLTAPTTWHDFRRTFISDLLAKGVDIATIAKLVGHSSVTTTARYDRRPAEARRAAARLTDTPYFERSRQEVLQCQS